MLKKVSTGVLSKWIKNKCLFSLRKSKLQRAIERVVFSPSFGKAQHTFYIRYVYQREKECCTTENVNIMCVRHHQSSKSNTNNSSGSSHNDRKHFIQLEINGKQWWNYEYKQWMRMKSYFTILVFSWFYFFPSFGIWLMPFSKHMNREWNLVSKTHRIKCVFQCWRERKRTKKTEEERRNP